jgi:hypothetical protein
MGLTCRQEIPNDINEKRSVHLDDDRKPSEFSVRVCTRNDTVVPYGNL